ncbi:MAG: hypothetical protein ABR526_10700, partial [Chthoniobacterales bacterium]
MKIKNVRRAAFFNLRALIASLLCLTAGMLALLAFGVVPQQPDDKGQTTSSSRWLTGLASTLGIESQRSAGGGGAVPVHKDPAERVQGTSLPSAAVPYTGLVPDLRPVAAVRSGKLRDMPPIDPATVPKLNYPEPILPPPPTDSAGPEGPLQRTAGPQLSAPTPTGLSFDGVGVGLAGYSPSSNPPDVNGRV